MGRRAHHGLCSRGVLARRAARGVPAGLCREALVSGFASRLVGLRAAPSSHGRTMGAPSDRRDTDPRERPHPNPGPTPAGRNGPCHARSSTDPGRFIGRQPSRPTRAEAAPPTSQESVRSPRTWFAHAWSTKALSAPATSSGSPRTPDGQRSGVRMCRCGEGTVRHEKAPRWLVYVASGLIRSQASRRTGIRRLPV